ncbi:MAG TPA: hypothetical protein VGG84_03895, partial [Gemmatimonadaceae bacterium]
LMNTTSGVLAFAMNDGHVHKKHLTGPEKHLNGSRRMPERARCGMPREKKRVTIRHLAIILAASGVRRHIEVRRWALSRRAERSQPITSMRVLRLA